MFSYHSFGLIATILVYYFKPVLDTYYYFASFFSISMAILSLLSIIRKTNKLALRKPPQLGKRGGDENA